MTDRAKTVTDAYKACNPGKLLEPNDDRYVDLTESRGGQQLAQSVTRKIQRSEEKAHVKLLFTGHRGSGKTTELLRLKQKLEAKKIFTIYMDAEELLDPNSLSYLDVLVAIAQQVQVRLKERKMPLSDELLYSIANWFAERITEETKSTELQGCVSTGVQAGSKIPFFFNVFAKVTADLKTGSSQRETIRTNLRRELSVFIDKLNTLIITARQTVQEGGYKDIVLIVDGMEKMPYQVNKEGISNHSELFVYHAEQLRSPQCHIIYTVPISLLHTQNLGADFDDVHVLPMVRKDEQGISKLIEIVKRRVDTDLVFSGPELLERLVRISGGVVRDLMRLVRMATDTDADKIGADEIEYAVSTLRKEYERLLLNKDIDSLLQIQKDKHIRSIDGDAARLLHLRLVLEYENDGLEFDLHPIVCEIPWVKEKLAENAA